MLRTAPRRGRLGLVVAALLLAAACGTTEPEPLKAMEPEVPADLCATVPAALRQGLITDSTTDPTGNPTAACSLRSPGAESPQVHAVVTWVDTNDDSSANQVWDSQCRAIDRQQFKEQAGFKADGADQACAASGKVDGADSATLAALSGRQVVTVRLSSLPPGKAPVMDRGQAMLEGVIHSVAGDS
jgi:hypothetical protein